MGTSKSLDVLNPRSEASLVEQDLKFKTNFFFKKNHLHFMQLFSADATFFKKKYIYENIKNTPPEVAHNQPNFFSVLPTGPKTAQISISVP